MLHLQAGVHFEEKEAAVLAGDELNGASAVVLNSHGQGHSLVAHGFAGGLVQQGAGGFFDDLLVAPLDRAFPLEEVDDMAVFIAQHLNFDVAGAFDEFLDEDAVVAETGLGLGLHGREALLDVLAVPGDADTLAAAAGRRLQHHRIADVLGDPDGVRRVVDFTDVAWHH